MTTLGIHMTEWSEPMPNSEDMNIWPRPGHLIHPMDFRLAALAGRALEVPPTLPFLMRPPTPEGGAPAQLQRIREALHDLMVGEDATGVQARDAMSLCLQAMDDLRGDLLQELRAREQLELKNFDAHTALAQLKGQLRGSQAGERRARHLALHDALTALPNRQHFLDRLKQVMSGPQRLVTPVAVLFIDLDHFKAINDHHGHGAGDEVLSITAARLTHALRSDDMVGRLGGDEFACLLMNVPSKQHLGQLACKLFDAVSAPVKIGDLAFEVRPSIGVATAGQPGLTPTTLLHRADLAMYQAKRAQTGYAFFSAEGHIAGD
jgi:diguanylate cyclase